jgi:hypothetical protein
MLDGNIDAVSSCGFIAGWALDSRAVLKPLEIAILEDGAEIARGYANIYRSDLVAASRGTGWHGYRLRCAASPMALSRTTLVLAEAASGNPICQRSHVAYAEESDAAISSLQELLAADPMLLASIDQLDGCKRIFEAFIHTRGVEAFVKAAYLYVLDRPCDPAGLGHYSRLIRNEWLGPEGLVRALYNCEEFRSRPRTILAPNTPGFPFSLESTC